MNTPASFIDWHIGAGLWAASALLAGFAAYVTLDLARGVLSRNVWTSARSLMGASAAAAAGGWAAHAVVLSRAPLPVDLNYGGWGVVLALLVSLGFCMLSLRTALRAKSRWQIPLAGVALGIALCAAPSLNLNALLFSHPLAWQWTTAGIALALAAALATGALATFPRRWLASRQPMAAHLLASAMLGGAMMAGNAGMVLSAGVPVAAHPPLDGDLSAGMLTVLAMLGVPGMLALLLVSSVIEARAKAALRRTREELLQVAQTDPLTRLPNRVMFETALQRAVARADSAGESVALLFLNMDGLKGVNESFGQGTGDALLRQMADRLRGLVGQGDVVARAGGDEFLLLLDGDPSRDAAAHLANRLLKAMNEPCMVEEREVSLTCSMGITVYPQHGGLSKLIAHAAAAMHAAKRNGGAAYCFFEPSMVAGARDQVDLLRDLRRAIQQHELELYYQPKIHAPSGQITGAEALMRWHHPQRGLVGPDIFIPLAERFGLIQAMGNWLIEDVCRQIRAWRGEGLRMRVSINLSVHQLRQEDLVQRIEEAMQRHQIEPHVLTCEITETAAMEDTRASLKVIERLAAAGVHLSIDDFGTGYSSLSYLRQLSAGELKIDRSFVLDLESSADARAIVDAVVKLAQALGLKVVAEGVETEEQQKILRLLGCDELQGYLFAKPMSAKSLTLWAMEDEGPRPMMFRPSLFGDTLIETPLH